MVRPGIYRHYKGNLYRVLFTAWESTNGRERRPVVVYVSLTRGCINVRDESEFTSWVTLGPEQNYEAVPRFAHLKDDAIVVED